MDYFGLAKKKKKEKRPIVNFFFFHGQLAGVGYGLAKLLLAFLGQTIILE